MTRSATSVAAVASPVQSVQSQDLVPFFGGYGWDEVETLAQRVSEHGQAVRLLFALDAFRHGAETESLGHLQRPRRATVSSGRTQLWMRRATAASNVSPTS